MRQREGNALPGDRIVRDKSGQKKNATKRRALTLWKPSRKGQVRTTKTLRPSKGGPLSGYRIGRNKSRHRKKGPSNGHPHSGNGIGRDTSEHGKNTTEWKRPTFWGRNRKAQVKTTKESDRARGTHELETASRDTTQDRKRKRPSEGHSRTGDTMSGVTSQDTGTIRPSDGDSHPRDRMGGQVRTQKESGRVRGTHLLEIASGGTIQDTKRIQPREGRSPTGDGIGRDKPDHRKNASERNTHFLDTAE